MSVADALGVGVRDAALAEADGVLAAVHLVDGDSWHGSRVWSCVSSCVIHYLHATSLSPGVVFFVACFITRSQLHRIS